MSNVLIGIIGVILFIGLALAGALILGDDFRSSTSESKAAAVVQQQQQIVAALNMYALKTGRTPMANGGMDGVLVPRFLKVYPRPAAGSYYALYDAGGNGGTASPIRMVAVNLGTDDVARSICSSIEEQMSSRTPDMSVKTSFPGVVNANNRTGCFLYGDGNHYAYTPL